jgi:hypothetical protein
VFAVAAAITAGWLLLFLVLVVLPPASQRRQGEDAATGAEPPAVVSALAGRLGRDGFGVTLADLAVRGWFRLCGTPGRAGPVMCVIPVETPAEPLTPYERRVMAHVALRAGVRGEVPAPALSDSFEGGESAFRHAFREEVTADVAQRGLTRPRLSGRRIGLLCLALLVPAGALALALAGAHQHDPLALALAGAHQHDPLAFAGGSWFVLSLVTIGVGASRRPSSAGQAVLDRWHVAADAVRGVGIWGHGDDGDGRVEVYAAALGLAPGVVTIFAPARRSIPGDGERLAAADTTARSM